MALVVGITSPVGGSSLVSVMMEEARYVPFPLRIEEVEQASTEVKVWAGGAQGALGFDYGHNSGVAERILSGLEPHRDQ